MKIEPLLSAHLGTCMHNYYQLFISANKYFTLMLNNTVEFIISDSFSESKSSFYHKVVIVLFNG